MCIWQSFLDALASLGSMLETQSVIHVFEILSNLGHIFRLSSVYVQSRFREGSEYVQSRFRVFRVFPGCVQGVFRVCTACVQSVFQGEYRVCSEWVQSMFRVCSECVQSVFRLCSEYVQSMFRVCSEYVQSMFYIEIISSPRPSILSIFGIITFFPKTSKVLGMSSSKTNKKNVFWSLLGQDFICMWEQF